jgi:endoglucanase
MTRAHRWFAAALLGAALVVPLSGAGAATGNAAVVMAPYSSLSVVGNHLVTDGGKTVRLLGVQQQGLEYMCVANADFLFDSTHDQATIDAMKSWHVNTVRLPINESCWLGKKGVPANKDTYRQQVIDWVNMLRSNDLFVIIDNHVATDGSGPASDILPMADATAVAMWKSVAKTFKTVPGVAFDLYNEPNNIDWPCWLKGCKIPAGTWINTRTYKAVGMQKLVNAVRGAGAKQPIILGGINWSNDNSQWMAFRPKDKLNQLIVDQHVYGPSPDNGAAPCDEDCRGVLSNLAASTPVVTGEMGEVDCAHGYIDDYMAWADQAGVGYIGETWNATSPGGYTCESPVLLEDFNYPDPTPTPLGVGFRDHMQSIDTAPH